jgi:hypothetical protein
MLQAYAHLILPDFNILMISHKECKIKKLLIM